jgi:hypothetical protein
MNTLLLIAPLFVFALVVVLGFAGCTLNTRGTGVELPQAPSPYGEEVKLKATAYWRLSDPVTDFPFAKDEIGAPPWGDHYGEYHGGVAHGEPGQTPGLIAAEPDRPKAQFDGSGYVEVPHGDIFEAWSFTIEALVHPDKIGDTPCVIVSNMSPSGGWSLGIDPIGLDPHSPPGADGLLDASGADGLTSASLNAGLKLAELGTAWHIAMTYDVAKGVMLYRDGVPVLGPEFLPYVPNKTQPLQIGGSFQGAIQEVAYYANIVLSTEEIGKHFTTTQIPPSP